MLSSHLLFCQKLMQSVIIISASAFFVQLANLSQATIKICTIQISIYNLILLTFVLNKEFKNIFRHQNFASNIYQY